MAFVTQLGFLRVMLAGLALFLIIFFPGAQTEVSYSGWALVRSLLIPALAPLVFMVLMLDVLMSRVLMSDTEGAARRRFRLIIGVNLVFAAGIVLAGLPFFLALTAN